MVLKYAFLVLSTVFFQSVSAQLLNENIQIASKTEDELWVSDPNEFIIAFLNAPTNFSFQKFEKMEIGITLPPNIDFKVRAFTENLGIDSTQKINPYLEWELDVEARFVFENDTTNPIVVDGFFLQNYQSFMIDSLPQPKNGRYYTDDEYINLGGWRKLENLYPFHVRFAPPKAGNYQLQVQIQTARDSFLSLKYEFYVEESDNHGFVKVADNNRFLELDGNGFYPIGMNTPWPETAPEFDSTLFSYNIVKDQNKTFFRPEMYRVNGLCVPRVYQKYKEIWSKMVENGVNSVRTIMNPISTEIEWEKLGDYTNRLNQAQEMDELLEFAESNNLFIHWDLAIHFTFKFNVYYITQWDWIDDDGTPSYCYKKAFNLEKPIDFFTNESAKKYYKQRLRYILARWGYSTNISAFEIISEISNIGSTADDNDAFYQKNTQVYQDWQLEMGNYLKSLYNGKTHLLTASYSGEMSQKDSTFFKGKTYDFMTSNVYDFGTTDFASFFVKNVAKRFLNESDQDVSGNPYNVRCGEGLGNKVCNFNIKPLMFSEAEPIENRNNCSSSSVEINRSQWQSLFSGLAASFSWTNWYQTSNYSMYGQMLKWISTVDFIHGDWHPGASELMESDSLKRWNYNESFAESMDATWRKADISYLRSGDKYNAIGVLTNKTYNIFNIDTCLTIPAEIIHLAKREAVAVKSQKLKVKGLKKGRYQIDYYLPDNQDEPIFTSVKSGRNINIDLPSIAASKEGYIVLFRIHRFSKR